MPRKKPVEPEDAGATSGTSERWPTPAHWRWARVSEVGNVKLGRQLASSKRRGTTPTPYIRAANVSLNGLDLTEVLKMDLTERERESLQLSRGDVVLAEASGSPSHVGRSAVWNDEIPGCCFQNTVVRFRPHALMPEYALLVFRYFLAAGVFARASHGVGIQHLGASRFAQIDVPVPGPAEQARIVEEANRRLDHLAKSAVSMESALRGIQDQVTAVLEAAATGQLGRTEKPAPGREPTTTIGPLARISLPEGWRWVRVAEAGEPKLGRQRAPKYEQGKDVVPYLRVANVFEDRIDTSDLLSMNFTPEEQETYRLLTGDILLNEGQSAELVGRPAMYRGEPPMVFFQNTLVRFRPADTVNPEFALIVFRFYLRSGVFKSIARWSTNIAHLGLQRFAELPFPLPPRKDQDDLVALAHDMIRQLEEQRASVLTSLVGVEEMLREILIAAVRGDLSKPAPGEESAEDMLARLGPPPKEKPFVRAKDVPEDADVEDQADGHQDLGEVLKRGGGKATAENLFAAAGYDRDLTTEVEGFYLSLRDSLGKTIRSAGFDGSSSVLEVIPDAAT